MRDPAYVHLVLYAKEIENLGKFYQNLLGLTTVERSERFVVLQGESYELSIVAIHPEAAEQIELRSPPVPREETPIKVSFLITSIEDCRHPIESAGGQLKPQTALWEWRGQKHLDGVDPEGNVFQLRQIIA